MDKLFIIIVFILGCLFKTSYSDSSTLRSSQERNAKYRALSRKTSSTPILSNIDRNFVLNSESLSTKLNDSQNLGLIQTDDDVFPKLEIYFGRGYNIYYGNPLAKEIDPGFKQKKLIFKFNYDGNVMTEDGLYFIPKEVDSISTTTCTSESHSNSYSGMRGYLQDINAAISISGDLGEGSGSLSVEYKQMSNTINNEDKEVTMVQLNCRLYSITLQRNLEVLEEFVEDILDSLVNDNWDKFIRFYGTHFPTFVEYGAKAVQETIMDKKAAQSLKSLGVDVAIEAEGKIKIFKVGGKAKVGYSKDQEEKYDSVDKVVKNYYVGNPPPDDGTYESWMSTLKDSTTTPVPLSLHLESIKSLFSKKYLGDYFGNEDFIDMINGYNAALDKITSTITALPKSDPIPPKITITQHKTNIIGGGPGFYFEDPAKNNPLIKPLEIIVQSDNDRIYFVRIKLTDGATQFLTPRWGGVGGTEHKYVIPAGHEIRKVRIWWEKDYGLKGIMFYTENDLSSDLYGSNTQNENYVEVKGRLIGCLGIQNDLNLMAIGFISNEFS